MLVNDVQSIMQIKAHAIDTTMNMHVQVTMCGLMTKSSVFLMKIQDTTTQPCCWNPNINMKECTIRKWRGLRLKCFPWKEYVWLMFILLL